jgi:hypothetical protein
MAVLLIHTLDMPTALFSVARDLHVKRAQASGQVRGKRF